MNTRFNFNTWGLSETDFLNSLLKWASPFTRKKAVFNICVLFLYVQNTAKYLKTCSDLCQV